LFHLIGETVGATTVEEIDVLVPKPM